MEHFVDMDIPNSNGETKRQVLESVVRQTNREVIPEELKQTVRAPYSYRHIFDIFWSLGRRRTDMLPLPLTDITTWLELNKQKLNPFELDTLLAIDRAFLNALNKRNQ